MGTYVEVTVLAPDRQSGRELSKPAFAQIERIDSLMSTYKEDSDISRLNRLGQSDVSPESLYVIKRSLAFSRLTNGALDITYKPLMDIFEKAEKAQRFPTDEELKKAGSLVDYRDIYIEGTTVRFKKKGMGIDLSCIAKGFSVDKAIEALKRSGVKNALVNAGGDMYALGGAEDGGNWMVGIQDPRKDEGLIALLGLTNKAVATSGDYERYFSIGGIRYPYIFNLSASRPRETPPMSATVIASDCTTADALSTACFILGPKKGIRLIDTLSEVECLIITKSGRKLLSRGMKKFLTR